MNLKFRYSAKKDKDGELYLYGDIGGGMFGDGITAKQVVSALDAIDKAGARDLCIYINSGGGSVFDGMAIYNAIKRWEGKKIVYVDGLAASAASLIAMAGDTIKMSDAGIMMIHEPSGIAVGNMKEMEDVKSRLEKIRDSMVSVYSSRTGKAKADVEKLMADETWMTASEAIAEGFADETYESKADVEMRAVASASPYFSHYRNVPESIRAAARELPHKEKKMELLLRALGLPADASEAQAIKVVDDLRMGRDTADARHKSIHAELDDLTKLTGKPSAPEAKGVFLAWKQSQDQVVKLMAEKEQNEIAARSKEVDILVDNGVRDGKIPPSMKDFWKAQGNRELSTLKSFVEQAPKLVDAPKVVTPGVKEPAPLDPLAVVELSEAEQEKIFRTAGVTKPEEKAALIAKVKEQNKLLAQHGIKIPNSMMPA